MSNVLTMRHIGGDLVHVRRGNVTFYFHQNEEWAEISYDVSILLGVKWREDSDDHDRVVQAIVDLSEEEPKATVVL